jgi:hypothetical protein
MRALQSSSLVLIACGALAGCGPAEGGDGTECSSSDTNTPGSDCIRPVRFDFEPDEVDLLGQLAAKDIDFVEPEPDEGFQITTQGIKLAGGGDDDEFCEAFVVPEAPEGSDGTWCITRFEVAMTPGYHHLFVAKAPIGSDSDKLMEVGKRVRCVGGAHVAYGTDLMSIPLPQGTYVDVPYFEGVGMRLEAGQKISVNYHYLNVGDEDIIGMTKLNFHAAPCDGLLEMGQFGFYNQDIAVPPGGTASSEMHATFSQDVYVHDIFRHTHRFGTEVPISFYGGPRDGEVFFTSPDFEEGAGFRFPEPVLVKKGEGFKFVCNWENDTEKWLRFGPTADDEMCMLLGTWWVADPEDTPQIQHHYKWAE